VFLANLLASSLLLAIAVLSAVKRRDNINLLIVTLALFVFLGALDQVRTRSAESLIAVLNVTIVIVLGYRVLKRKR
jgi:hypothetical protein